MRNHCHPLGGAQLHVVDVVHSQRMSSFLNDPTVVSRSVGRVPVGVLPHRRARPRGHRAGRAWPSAGAVEAGRLDTSVLVDMEWVVHLAVHRGADCGQPDAGGRPAQARQDAADGTTDRCGLRIAGHPDRGSRAATQRLDRDRGRALILTAPRAGLRADKTVARQCR